jgi:hypothetical protein
MADSTTATSTTQQQSRRREAPPEPTGWVGWIAFAAAMMVIVGAWHIFQGLVALFNDDYYLVTKKGLTVHLDYTAWGWTYLVIGVVIAASGLGLYSGRMVARIVAVAVATVSLLVNFAFIASYPIWSTMLIAVDVLVIFAITAHGREMKQV